MDVIAALIFFVGLLAGSIIGFLYAQWMQVQKMKNTLQDPEIKEMMEGFADRMFGGKE